MYLEMVKIFLLFLKKYPNTDTAAAAFHMYLDTDSTIYSRTCPKDHLHIKTTCLQRPTFSRSQNYNSHCNSPVYKDHLSVKTTLFGPLSGLYRQVCVYG